MINVTSVTNVQLVSRNTRTFGVTLGPLTKRSNLDAVLVGKGFTIATKKRSVRAGLVFIIVMTLLLLLVLSGKPETMKREVLITDDTGIS